MERPLAAALALTVCLAGCSARPKPIAIMKNPTTGATVVMYPENRLKVPLSYNEALHVEQWKEEQRKLGYTVEEPPP